MITNKVLFKRALSCLINKYGVPTLENELAIYYDLAGKSEVHIKITGKRATVRVKGKDENYLETERISSMSIRPQDIKMLLRLFKDLGINQGSISEAIRLTIKNDPEEELYIMKDTLIGDFIVYKTDNGDKVGGFDEIMKKCGISYLSVADKKNLTGKISLDKQKIVDDLHKINEKIVSFCERNAIPLYTFDRSIDNLIKAHSNDYSPLEDKLRSLFKINISSRESGIKDKMLRPISIIVPFYNSNNTLEKLLASIQSQNISRKQKAKVEVVVVDDGSKIPLATTYSIIRGMKIDFTLKIIRLENNCGLSTARNVGVSAAKHETILFIDSDILLPSNYLLEMSVRSNLVPNAIFVSFKENVDISSPKISIASVKKGLPVCDFSQDSRIIKKVDVEKEGLYEVGETNITNVLADTDNFKKFGFGRNLGIYDLPSMVVGHNMICSKHNYKVAGGFSNNFIGWGMEDAFFGAKIIAGGNFVIPVLSTGVYHIDHPPRSGNEDKKREEFKKNLETYKKLLRETT